MKNKFILSYFIYALVEGCLFASCTVGGGKISATVPNTTDDYFSRIEDFHRTYFGSKINSIDDDDLALYVDYSTCNVLGQSSDFYQALVPSWVDATKEYYSIKGNKIEEEDGSVFSLLKSITNYDYADLKGAINKMADDDHESVLLTDGEYFQKAIALGNINNPYMKDAFTKWLKKGHDIFVFAEPYQELYKGNTYNKKRFYIIFTDTRLSDNIYGRIMKTVDLTQFPQVEMFHLSADHPTLSAEQKHTTPNDVLSAKVKGFGSFEVQDWQVDWDNVINPYIVNAVNPQTGMAMTDGDTFTGGLKIDRNSFGGYRIKGVSVNAYDINQEFTDFNNAKDAKQKVGGEIKPVKYQNFVKIDNNEFTRHGVINLHFDTQNFDPSILTGSPFNYFKLDICITDVEDIFSQYANMFTFDSIDQPGQQNVSVAESIKQCLAEPDIKAMMMNSVIYSIYIKTNEK